MHKHRFTVWFAGGLAAYVAGLFVAGMTTLSLKEKKKKENSHSRSDDGILVVKGVEHFFEDEAVTRTELGDFFVDGEVFVIFPVVANQVIDGDTKTVRHFDEKFKLWFVEPGFVDGDGALFEAKLIGQFFLAPVAPLAEGFEIRFPCGWVPFSQNISPSFRSYYNT